MRSFRRVEAAALAGLCRAIRPKWDELKTIEVLDTLAAQGLPLAEVAYAAIKTAQDPTRATPTAIAFDGEHWPTGYEAAPPADRGPLDGAEVVDACPYCDRKGRLTDGNLCRHDGLTDAERQARHSPIIAQAKALAAGAKTRVREREAKALQQLEEAREAQLAALQRERDPHDQPTERQPT